MLNDFNSHRKNIKNRSSEIIQVDDDIVNIKNIAESYDTVKNNQDILSNNYNQELNTYLKNENKEKNLNINNRNETNELNAQEKEISTLRQEMVLLKTKITENELTINQYKKNINTLKSEHSEEIKNFKNHIDLLNNYILAIYGFLNKITNDYYPELNFNYFYQENIFKLLDIQEFNEKLLLLENYISSFHSICNENNNINKKNQLQNNDIK